MNLTTIPFSPVKHESCLACSIRPAHKPENDRETVKNKTDDTVEQVRRAKLDSEGAAVNYKTPYGLKKPSVSSCTSFERQRLSHTTKTIIPLEPVYP